MSSSPVFPSPNALVRKRPQLRSSSLAAPIPTPATPSFTSAVQLLSERQPIADSITTKESIGNKPRKLKTARKPKTIEKATGGDESTAKKPRKSRAKKSEVDADTTAPPAEKAPRKYRAKNDTTESQSKMPKGRVTKASTDSQAVKGGGKRKTAVVSRHFASAALDSADPFDTSKISENDLLLKEALKRRRDWTPPKANADPSNMIIGLDEKDGGAPSLLNASSENQNKPITGLFEKFGYSNGEDKTTPERTIDRLGTKKRKLIELVSMNNNAAEPPISKAKAVRKKPRTITELATSVYATGNIEDDQSTLPAPLLQNFSRDDTPSADKVPRTTDGFKVPPKPRSKSPAKVSSKASQAKKRVPQAPILLSPQTALKRVEKQQFVFGTSSQLAREDSPTLLRDLHQAMRASNELEDDPLAETAAVSLHSKSASTTESSTVAYMARRNLWAAASRGVEGTVMKTEDVDMSKSPQVLMSLKPSPLESNQDGIPSESMLKLAGDEWHDLDAEDSRLKANSCKNQLQSSKVGPVEATIRLELGSSPPRGKETRKSTSPRRTKLISKPPDKTGILPKQISTAQKPDYGSYPTARLAKEVASYHFKPVKGRDQMILLLEKCWEGMQMVASNTSQKALEANVSSILDSNKPLVLRQTPKKQKKKASLIPEEIYDSDGPLTPSPPRRTKVRTPPLPLQLSVAANIDKSLPLSPKSQQVCLHRHITRAITMAPPSKDPKAPSWHEKILLYDPIILEDLTTWLNTGALEKVGWDEEVDPKEVKKWCLEKSICCLWRENLRGAARSRY